MSLRAELAHLACVQSLGHKIRDEFPRVRLDIQGTSDAMTVAWFGTNVPGEVNVMVTIAANGQASVGTGEGMLLELFFPSLDADEVTERLFEEVRDVGLHGVEFVRTMPMLGRLSPSWVGPAGSPEVLAAKAHRHARVIAVARPWSV